MRPAATRSAPDQAGRLPTLSSYGSRIEVRSDIEFGGGEQQKFDLYMPATGGTPPVVVCWYGGAFYAGDRINMAEVGAFLAARGFAVAAPGYYLGTKDGSRAAWPRAVNDAKAIVRHIRGRAAELGVDANRIGTLGYSAGAYLAMMVGFTPNLSELEGSLFPPTHSSRVSAVVTIAGVCDRRRDIGLPLALLGAGYEEKYDLRVASSPILYVNRNTVPVYILHGRRDSVVDASSATQLASALKEAGVAHALRLVDTDHYPISSAEMDRIADWLGKVL